MMKKKMFLTNLIQNIHNRINMLYKCKYNIYKNIGFFFIIFVVAFACMVILSVRLWARVGFRRTKSPLFCVLPFVLLLYSEYICSMVNRFDCCTDVIWCIEPAAVNGWNASKKKINKVVGCQLVQRYKTGITKKLNGRIMPKSIQITEIYVQNGCKSHSRPLKNTKYCRGPIDFF